MRLSVERANELLRYDPKTGKLFWRVSRGRVAAGQEAGCVETVYGDVLVGVDGKIYQAHRIIWLIRKGYMPAEIDHRNRRNSDNRWCNLREATRQQNQCNRGRPINNRSGFKGVHRHKDGWRARICVRGVHHCGGVYATPELAARAYNRLAKKHHANFACLNGV